jgi:hypothetical protein
MAISKNFPFGIKHNGISQKENIILVNSILDPN